MLDPLDSQREGFGSRLLRMAVESQLGGRFERLLANEGLTVDLVFPVEKLFP